MKQSLHGGLLRAALILLICGFAGCGGRSGGSATGANAGGGSGTLTCGSVTYRISPERIDSELSAACERFKQSAAEARAQHAGRTRFTCTDAAGHVVLSMPVPSDLLEQYDHNCRQFLSADQAFHAGSGDRQAHFAALKQLQDQDRQLTSQTVEAANEVWRRNRADQAALNELVRSRGGSIEIAD